MTLSAAGAYGIEDMIPDAGPGLTLVMLIVLPFVWSTPMGLVAAELGSAIVLKKAFGLQTDASKVIQR